MVFFRVQTRSYTFARETMDGLERVSNLAVYDAAHGIHTKFVPTFSFGILVEPGISLTVSIF